MKEKQVITKKQFDYDRTLLVTGLIELPGEDPMKIAEQLLDKGLGKGNLKIVRAKRIPTNHKPSPFKIELESEEAKKEALAETGRLIYYKAQGNKVIVRSSMRFEDRIQKGNWDTMRKTLGLENQLRLSKHGKLLPNTYSQQPQQQQQYLQQYPQMQQQHFQTQQQPQNAATTAPDAATTAPDAATTAANAAATTPNAATAAVSIWTISTTDYATTKPGTGTATIHTVPITAGKLCKCCPTPWYYKCPD